MEEIRSGEINCVVVKDFSRFGGDYIELGDYLERIFPFLGVRFISINDHYDSDDYMGTTGRLDVVMKNIVYDFYSRDLSVKVKTAKMSKMKQRKYLGGHVPYGLRRHDAIKGKLAIDEEAAEIVRCIFGYALESKTCSMIARELNAEAVLPARSKTARRTEYVLSETASYRFFLLQYRKSGNFSIQFFTRLIHKEVYLSAQIREL